MKRTISVLVALCTILTLSFTVFAELGDSPAAEYSDDQSYDLLSAGAEAAEPAPEISDPAADPEDVQAEGDVKFDVASAEVVYPSKAPTEVPAEYPNSALLEITDDDYMHGVVNIYYKNGIFYTDATCTNQFRGIWINLNYPFVSYSTMQDIFATVSCYNDDISDDGVAFFNVGVRIDKINVHMLSTYTFTSTETLSGMDWVSAYQPNYDKFSPYFNIIREDGFYGPMLNVSTPNEEHLVLGHEVTVDNRVAYPDRTTVAIEIPDLGNLMLRGGKITNSLAGETRETYAGIGVQLTGLTNGGALELWFNCVIEKCYIGSDQKCGTTRLKEPTPGDMYTVKDNYIAINVRRGTTIGKWTHDISMIQADDVIITLEDVTSWQDGDVIMTSGMENISDTERVKTPVFPSDIAKIKFTNREDMTQVLSLMYDDSVSSSVDMLYPLVRFASKVVYNTRTHEWFETLYLALQGGDYGILENDTLVFYGYTKETHECYVDKNLTIRSAVPGFDDAKIGYTPSYSGCAASWLRVESGHIQCFSVKEGKKVYIATGKGVTGNQSVPLTFDFNTVSRGVYTGTNSIVYMDNFIMNDGYSTTNGGGVLMGNYSTLNTTMNTQINNCTAENGGGIYVGMGAVLNVSEGTATQKMTISGCKADFGGGLYIYGTGGTPNSNDGVVNFAGGALLNNGPRYSVVCGSAIYQNGKFNLTGDADFENNDVYLPSISTSDTSKVRVITDNGYTGDDVIAVSLGNDTVLNEYVGRNYVEGSDVYAAKLNKYEVLNVKVGLECVYTADDTLIHAKVLELAAIPAVSITITKTCDVEPRDDQSFVFYVRGKAGTPTADVNLTVVINKTGSVTITNLPIGEYTVVEDLEWAYRYTSLEFEITHYVDSDGISFDFMNYLVEDKWLTYDCFAQNLWTGSTVTRKH